jgi:endonuclease-3
VKRAEKARRIQAILDELYPEARIPLEHEDPFTLLVAVVLSAQCTDAKVNQVTPALFARARTPEAMARLPVAEIQRLIAPLGLAPTKARHLAALARQIVLEHGGKVPDRFEALEALPGVGHKTASVVMSQAFGRPAFPVDTHIHRLAARWGLSSGRSVAQTERDLMKLFPPDAWRNLHLQVIYFGREHCPARGHDLSACRICSWAASRARIRREARPRSGRAARRSRAKPRQARPRRKRRKRPKGARSEPQASEAHQAPRKAAQRPRSEPRASEAHQAGPRRRAHWSTLAPLCPFGRVG